MMDQLTIALLLTSVILPDISFSSSSSTSQNGLSAACSYADSVNLTDYPIFPNGSYLYDGIVIPASLTGTYDYEIDELLERVPAEPHIRGCVCKLKQCVQFCCPRGEKFNEAYGFCMASNRTYIETLSLTTERGHLRANVFQKFAIQIRKPCIDADIYFLNPHVSDADNFSIFENGTLYRWYDEKYLSRQEYCLSPYRIDNFTQILLPANCVQAPQDVTKSVVYSSLMLFSVPFMALTIAVYTALPELRTLHGKSLCCYLLGLCFGYSILSAFHLIPPANISQFFCSFLGFSAYFSFMASFFWLSVISFDLFYNIRAPRGRFNEKKRFILYSMYSWGMAFIFLSVTVYAQQASWIGYDYQPSIGSNEYCWLNVKIGWSAFIYFYGPIVIIIAFNITMFILTSLKINNVQKEMSRMMQSNDCQRNLRTEKDRFGIFLRLFIVMGVTWSMEIISYCIGSSSPWDDIFIITDILNGIQGFVIFTLFVLKRKIKQYIVSRYQSTSQKERASQSSNKTTTSTISIPMNGTGATKPLINKFVALKN